MTWILNHENQNKFLLFLIPSETSDNHLIILVPSCLHDCSLNHECQHKVMIIKCVKLIQ